MPRAYDRGGRRARPACRDRVTGPTGCGPRAAVLFYNSMVVGLPGACDVDEVWADLVFGALADRTRRDILRRSVDGELSVSALARNYEMSVTAVQKHVAVLDRAGLVTKRRRGREQRVRTDLDAIHAAQLLLDRFEELWRDRIDRFTDLLDETTEGAGP